MKSLVEQNIPFLSEDMQYMTVTKVLISVGDKVESGQLILEIETEKVVVEIPSDFTGIIQRIAVSEGNVVQAGDVMCAIQTEKEIHKEDYSSFVSELKTKLGLDVGASFDDILRTVEQLKSKG